MKMKQSKAVLVKMSAVLASIALTMSACTKQRTADLPEKDQVNTFAISDFGDVQNINSSYSVKTDSEQISLDQTEAVKADNETGKVYVDSAQVPEKLQFMFNKLKISAAAKQAIPITFGIDKKYVTAYKITTDYGSLSALEKQFAKLRDEVVLKSQIQKATEKTQAKAIMAQIQNLQKSKLSQSAKFKESVYLVPIFKYSVTGYGVLQKVKNELHEDTSTLELKQTEWSQATHIQIKALRDDNLPVAFDPKDKTVLDRTFATSQLNNKIMKASDLSAVFQIPTKGLDDKALVLTSLDAKGLSIYQFAHKKDLSETQLKLLQSGKLGSLGTQVVACSNEMSNALKPIDTALAKDCYMIYRMQVAVTYKKSSLVVSDIDGSETPDLQLEDVAYSNNVGLVTIQQNVEPTMIQADDIYDSSSMIRVSDLKGKEFFFRRTLESAPFSSILEAGNAGDIAITKFELQDTRLVLKYVENIVTFESGSDSTDTEELMNIPVTYVRRELKDSMGNAYAAPKIVPTNKESAEYIVVNWAKNELPISNSPIALYGFGQCLINIANTNIVDLDNRIDQGVLNFSLDYSTSLNQECAGFYSGVNDYSLSGRNNQYNARVRERVSLKLNDGVTDKAFVASVPYKVQNALGYGVWTLGQTKPDAHGQTGYVGTQKDLPAVQDFRQGRVLKYTITGLENLDPHRKEMNLNVAKEVIASWNLAYKNVFKGSAFERKGDYITYEVSGENGVSAHIGDLDKNIIHFETKSNDNSGTLGLSQVGVNPRSAIVVADSLIIYSGNLETYIAALKRNHEIITKFESTIDELHTEVNKDKSKYAFDKDTLNLKQHVDAEANAQQSAQNMKTMDVPKSIKDIQNKENKNAIKNSNKIAKLKPRLDDILGKIDFQIAQQKRDYWKTNGNQKTREFKAPEGAPTYLQNTMKFLSQNPTASTQELHAFVANEMLNDKNLKLPNQAKLELKNVVNKNKAKAQVKAYLANKPGCMLEGRDELVASFTKNSFDEAYMQALRFDIAHEMGHSQGLTHNFIGSFDVDNFNIDHKKFEQLNASINEDLAKLRTLKKSIENDDVVTDTTVAHEKLEQNVDLKIDQLMNNIKLNKQKLSDLKTSNYSSVMDYFDPAEFQWSGIGEYDIHALRAAHLNLVESKVPNKFVSINLLITQLLDKGTSITDITADDFNSDIRTFKYCNDMQVGYEPVCQRFDNGTTPLEIVNNLIKSYNEKYILLHHDWDRLRFSWNYKAYAISSAMNEMFTMRQFLDETFYQAIVKQDDAKTAQNILAANAAYKFYQQVIRIPDTTGAFESLLDRYSSVPYIDVNNKPNVAVVESRASSDIAKSDDRFDTIGIEYDKAFALQLLTMRGFPARKYEELTLDFSFMDFETVTKDKDPSKNKISRIIKEIMQDNLTPSATIDNVGDIDLSGINRTTTITPLIRYYTGISAIVLSEASTLTDKQNYANLFKVGSSLGNKAPTDRFSLSQLDSSPDSQGRMSYWAIDNADVISSIIDENVLTGVLYKYGPKISGTLAKIVELQAKSSYANKIAALEPSEANTAAAKAAADELAMKTNPVRDELANIIQKMQVETPGLDQLMEITSAKDLANAMIEFNSNVLDMTIYSFMKNDPKLYDADALSQFVVSHYQDNILYAYAINALTDGSKNIAGPGKLKYSDAIGTIKPDFSKEFASYSVVIKNLEFLSQLTLMMNPEYNR